MSKMNSIITLMCLLISFNYAAMEEVESPQVGRGLPGAHAPLDHLDPNFVIKFLAVGIVLLITLIFLLIMYIIINHQKMEMLLIQIEELAEEKVNTKHEETQTEDLIMYSSMETQTEDLISYRSMETQTEENENEPSAPMIIISSATPAPATPAPATPVPATPVPATPAPATPDSSPRTPRRGAAAASPNPSPRAAMFATGINPNSLREVRDGLRSPHSNPRPGTSAGNAAEIYICEECDIVFHTLKEFVLHSMRNHRTPPSKRKLDYFYFYQHCNTDSKKRKI